MKNFISSLILIAAFCFAALQNAEAQTKTPGGISMSDKSLDLWVDGDYTTNSSWTNVVPANHTLVKFSTNAPATRNGLNYHREMYFGNQASSKLRTSNPYALIPGQSYYVFVVSDARNAQADAVLLTFNAGAGSATNTSLRWNSSASNKLSAYWTTTALNPNWAGAIETRIGIATMNIVNSNSSTLDLYLNGTKHSLTLGTNANTDGAAQYNSNLLVGNANNDTSTGNTTGFNGAIQEIIVIRKTSSALMTDTDIKKIHSYLAIKYGVTLSHDYLAANGATVWNMGANAAFNTNIFGLAHDETSGLYQKQSRSIGNSTFAAFVGNSISALNITNLSGYLSDGVYVMFGSNNGNNNNNVDLGSPIPVAGSTVAVNFRKALAYRVQVTGAPSVRVKLQRDINMPLPKYLLVSSDPNFAPGTTTAIPAGSTVEVDLPNNCYISFGDYKTIAADNKAPGGVTSGLRVWLRADETAAITTEHIATSNAANHRLLGYPDAPQGTMVLGVTQWKDLVRNHTYTYANAEPVAIKNNHREPVYQPSNYMTNYHPALRFWGTDSYATYLSNSSGLWSTKFPTNHKHSAFFMVNNNYTNHHFVYTMFLNNSPWVNTAFLGPGYGVQRLTTEGQTAPVRGRFRVWQNGDNYGRGTQGLYAPGSTAILGYHAAGKGTTAASVIDVQFRFNGKENTKDAATNGADGFDLRRSSIIGSGTYDHDRALQGVMSEIIMYDGELTVDNRNKIESYLALKYGITLTPDDNATKRFDYKFSDGTTFWQGNVASGPYVTFYNRIAAVIRDDNALLNNRHSHSTLVGSILHMGVAGKQLGNNPDVNELYDKEAVIWGDNNATGVQLTTANACGDFEYVFNRKWMVHKQTQGNRPVTMIVGAQDNSQNQLGANNIVSEYFSKLKAGFDVKMIVADSVEKLTFGHPRFGHFTSVVPMNFIDGEQQCSYTFSNDITYVTFAYKTNNLGCESEKDFEGVKVFPWTQWERQNYGTILNQTKPAYSLGDDISVTSTNISYQGGTSAPAYFPSVTNGPVAGSISLQRRGGIIGSDVVVTVDFNTPIRPEFSIYNIDGYGSRYEEVVIEATCSGGTVNVTPELSYASNPNSSFYTISGNKATANRPYALSNTDKNGQLNVAFQLGVTKLIIKYRVTHRDPTSAVRNLIISPIRIRKVPPPPSINQDEIAFVKEVKNREITLCEDAEYSFFFTNVNCEARTVDLRDTLPLGMKWNAYIALDALNSNPALNPDINFNSYTGTNILHINKLIIPGSSTIKIMASATLDDNAVPVNQTKRFDNRAWVVYQRLTETPPIEVKYPSADRETLEPFTWFNASWAQLPDGPVQTNITVSPAEYIAESLVNVTVTANNPNPQITNIYLDLRFDAGFEYNSGFTTSVPGAQLMTPIAGAGTVAVAGNVTGTAGFILPNGVSTFTFVLKAPTQSNLEEGLDDDGNVIPGKVATMNVIYEFSGGMGDPCLHIEDMAGEKPVPFKSNKAVDDLAHTTINTGVTIPVLANDDITPGCSPTLTPIVPIPGGTTHGTAVTVPTSDSIRYTPATNYVGVDSLAYTITCGYDVTGAKIYVIVIKPGSQKYVACQGAKIKLSVAAIYGVTYSWHNAETGGTPLAGNVTEYEYTKTGTSTERVWVQAVWQGKTFPRYPIEILPGSNCGGEPSGCLTTGTVVWKEDFDSYGTTEDRADNPLWTGTKTTYTYVTRTNYLLPDVGEYALLKGKVQGTAGMTTAWSHDPLHDHTSPSDNTKGYFMTFDANTSPGTFFTFEMNNLCSGTDLMFSAWLMNINPLSFSQLKPIVEFVVKDPSNNVLGVFSTGEINRTASATWVNYAFPFTVPAGINAVKVEFINAQQTTGSQGNDISIDDIEVRFCTPEVKVTTPIASDTTLCGGSSITLAGNFTNAGTFGSTLKAQWFYSLTGDLSNPGGWTPLDSPSTIVGGTISKNYAISPAMPSHSGYYRLAVADEANFNNWNCRAMSRVIHLTVLPGITQGTLKSAQTICNNTAPTQLTLDPEPSGGSGSFTYKWQKKTTGDWSDIPSATGTSYTPPALTETTDYRIEVTDVGVTGNCKITNTNVVTIKVLPVPAVNAISNQIVCHNSPTTAVVFGTSVPAPAVVTYEWEVDDATIGLTNGAGTQINSFQAQNSTSSPKTLTVTVKPKIEEDGTTCYGATKTFTIKVYPKPTVNAVADQTVCTGDATGVITFGTTIGGGATVTYDWTRDNVPVGLGTLTGTGNIASFTATNTTNAPISTTVIVTPKIVDAPLTCTGVADTFYITVNPKPAITTTFIDTVCHNSGTFTITPVNGTNGIVPADTKYSWSAPTVTGVTGTTPGSLQSSISGGPLSNSTATPQVVTYTVIPSVTIGSLTCTGSSFQVKITVRAPLVAGTIKTDQTVCTGGSLSPLISDTPPSGGDGTYTYLWEYDTGSGWTSALGTNNTETYTPSSGTAGIYKYRRKVTSCGATATSSNVVTITVSAGINPGDISPAVPTPICYNAAAPTLSLVPTTPSGGAGVLTYKWYSSATGSAPWYDLGNDNIATYSPGLLTATTWYKVVVTDPDVSGDCSEASTNVIEVTVFGKFLGGNVSITGGMTVNKDTICYNVVPKTLTLAGVTGGKTPYTHTWQSKTLGASSWTNVPGSNSPSYTPVVALTETTMYRVETTDDASCGTVYSDTATVIVLPSTLLKYPDIRIYACPSTTPVNLSKFLDSLDVRSLTWTALGVSPAISPTGIIAANVLQSSATYTYTYKITNSCVTNTVSKVYLHVLTANETFRLRTDTVAVCYRYANNLQINRIFGLDDGSAIQYNPTPNSSGSVEPHMVKPIAGSIYAGALIFNAGDAYNDGTVLKPINYHGDAGAKYMEFTYTGKHAGCLDGKTYKVVVVLTTN